MQILVRLPNWLGDVVMSLAFLDKLQQHFPSAVIEVIIKKGLEAIIQNHPAISSLYTFDKTENGGLTGAWKFGKKISQQKKYYLFFCLPDSFSSAVMALASGAKHRAGYKNEFRSFLLTHSYYKPSNLHRVEEYCALIDLYLQRKYLPENTNTYKLDNKAATTQSKNYIVVNLNSEAISRRLPVEKSVELITMLQNKYNQNIKLIGAPNDITYVEKIYAALPSKQNIDNVSGSTSLSELIALMRNASFAVSTDSGPAHIASAANTRLVVIFGAGDEANTGPHKNEKATVVRHGALPCEPCVRNTCKLAPLPVCLTELDLNKVMNALDELNVESVL